MALGRMNSGDVLCLSCNREHTEALKRVRTLYPGTETVVREVSQPFRYRFLNYKGKTYPSVNAMIRRSRGMLEEADAVVTTSHGTPGMFRKYRIGRPKLIYQYHGCGDRRYGFDPAFRKMDMMLLPGDYHAERLEQEGITRSMKTCIVGWPKFDITCGKAENPFPNSNPTVLYCPHWEPALTSYEAFSETILEYFRKKRDMNLIFSPHLLVKHWRVHYGYRVYEEEVDEPNIIVDYGSSRAVDGTWLRAADAYAGDVSSMVYEFIAMKPRPCLFLNAHGVSWRNDPDYRFWEYGPVLSTGEELAAGLSALSSFPGKYLDLQKERIPRYFSMTGEPPSIRAARAISEYVVSL